jgi:hypothetical protein
MRCSEDMAERLKVDQAWLEEEGEVFDLLLDESASLVASA